MNTLLHIAAAWPSEAMKETAFSHRHGVLAIHRNAKSVRALLENGHQVDLWNADGLTPLHVAIAAWGDFYDNSDAVLALLGAGSSPEAGTFQGDRALHVAVRKGPRTNPTVVRLLIKHGADVNGRDGMGNTPLFRARTVEIAEALLEAGAMPNIKNKYGLTALDVAEADGLHEVAEVLRSASATTRYKPRLPLRTTCSVVKHKCA
ncbi:ankyrin repeat domain-containing protein [Robbsia sp. Bb-Pol-6]|uniref:Ankyrin repeat domain-containing protein n=1 Tax=Robbsia betulipollinis TaxID=2981849 RepID=A0ABT3ZTN7_9BURK|nr:ankyrin repeat domain-containing protein [Robbsia betulipollinis]MCY0389920.1 ankyrin repeat domain-containing protein [Robbsia betulipollinis]